MGVDLPVDLPSLVVAIFKASMLNWLGVDQPVFDVVVSKASMLNGLGVDLPVDLPILV